MTNTNLVKNPMLKDLDIFETIEDDAASKVVGGQEKESECTEENRKAITQTLLDAGFITSDEQATLNSSDLTKFCTDLDEYLGVTLAAQAATT